MGVKVDVGVSVSVSIDVDVSVNVAFLVNVSVRVGGLTVFVELGKGVLVATSSGFEHATRDNIKTNENIIAPKLF